MKTWSQYLLMSFLGGFLPASPSGASRQNPIEQVVSLLTKLQGQITQHGEIEANAYKAYQGYCADASFTKSSEIKSAKSEKEMLEAVIAKAASDIKSSRGRIEEVSASIAENEAKLKKAAEIRTADATSFKVSEKELMGSIEMLGKAVIILEKEMAKTGSAALLQTSEATQQLQDVVMGLGAVVDGATLGASEDLEKLTAMLQTMQHSEDSADDEGKPYQGKSGSIIDVLQDLRGKAESQLRVVRGTETQAKRNYDLLKQALTDEVKQYEKELTDEKKTLSDATKAKAQAESSLAITTKELSTATSDYANIQHDCMRKAADHETTTAGRSKELSVLAKTKKIIQAQLAAALAQTDHSASFLQLALSSRARISRAHLVGNHVVTLLQHLALQQHSASLTHLASRISAILKFTLNGSADDPFTKVKRLISDMIAKLEREQSNDATEKEYCDRELKKTAVNQEDLNDNVDELKSKIDQAASSSTKLKSQVKEISANLAIMAKLAKQSKLARKADHDIYLKFKSDLQGGLNSIRSAIHVLADYYAADDKESLVQIQSEETDSDSDEELDDMEQPAPPQKFEKSTSAGTGIIGLLEVIESDLAKNLAELQTEEDDEQMFFDKEMQQYKVTKSSKEQDITLQTRTYTSLDKSVSQLAADHASTSEELAAVNEYFAKVKDRCVAKPSKYADRKKNRESRIQGLQEALNILVSENSFLQRR